MEGIDYLTVDVFVGLVVFVSFVIGWIRGATREVLSVVAWVGGIYLTVIFFPHAKSIARAHIEHGLIADFVTSCFLFIAFLTVLSLLNYFFSNCVRRSALNTVDKALGGMFGVARAVILLAVIDIVAFQYIMSETPDWIKNSRSHPVVSIVSNFIVLVLPSSLQDKIVSHLSVIGKQNLLDFVKNNVIDDLEGSASENVLHDSESAGTFADEVIQDEDDISDSDKVGELPDDGEKKSESQTAKELATLKPKKSSSDNDESESKRKPKGKRFRMDMDRILSQTDDNQ
jgi:membrane protein required for colicin V production